MRTFTDDELAALINCSKQVVEPPRKEMLLEGKMKRNDMALKSVDGKHAFRVFMRQSDEFSEDFSIGLVYLPNEEPGSFILLRCNGKHGGELGVGQRAEDAGQGRQDKGEKDTGPRELGPLARGYENAGADDRADAQRGQVDRP